MNKKEAVAAYSDKLIRKIGTTKDVVPVRFEADRMVCSNRATGELSTILYSSRVAVLGDAVTVDDDRPRPFTFEELAKKVSKGTVLVYGNKKKNGVRYGKAITGISTHNMFQLENLWYNTTDLFNKFFKEDGTPFGKN